MTDYEVVYLGTAASDVVAVLKKSCVPRRQLASSSANYINQKQIFQFITPSWVSSVGRTTCTVTRYRANSLNADRKEEQYEQVYNNDNFEENKSSFGHELIAGGAAFAGFKAFEDHQRASGR